ncbi:MAG: histidine phosphatase family protein [Anaerolineales bacterium]|jgi:broad specificity phosphatase PhoE|nr:histidine phosphatase family protein [Anaerolineales bacterium]
MKTLEIRRHSLRNRAQPDLSEAGLALAHLVGLEMGKFERVLSSPLPRAIQTAEAMGYPVDETVELLSTTGDAVDLECPWPASFDEYAAASRQNGPTTRYVQRLADFYVKLAESLPENGAALVINHGGVAELSALACFPAGDFASLGDYLDYCEGVRLTWQDGKFTHLQVLRV